MHIFHHFRSSELRGTVAGIFGDVWDDCRAGCDIDESCVWLCDLQKCLSCDDGAFDVDLKALPIILQFRLCKGFVRIEVAGIVHEHINLAVKLDGGR